MAAIERETERAVASSHRECIFRHLTIHGTITPMEALRYYGCLRLGARIYDLKQQGVAITSSMIPTRTGKRVAQYSLVDQRSVRPRSTTAIG